MDTIKVIESQQSFAKSVYLDFMSKRFGITQTSITDLQSSISQKYLCDWQNAKKDVPGILEVTYDTFTPTDTSDPCSDVNAPTWCILCADGSCSDQECLIVSVVDSLGNPIKDFEIYIDGTNSGFTNADGEFLYTFENASADTKHTIQVCYCFITVGGCRQQKITIIVEADESAEECKVLTPCIDIKKKIIDELLTQVQVFFNDVLKYTQQCSIDLKFTLKNQDGDLIDATFNGYDIVVTQPVAADATVKNSDISYTASVASGATLILPDEDITVNGAAFLTKPSVKNQDIILQDQNAVVITPTTISNNKLVITKEDASVNNSDSSYTASVASGGTLVIPDEAITVNSAAFITKPSKKDQDILLKDVSGTTITPVSLSGNTITILDAVVGGSKGLMPIQTGQTTSYATNDDGDLQRGRLTDFNTIPYNNPFGNTFRFTDELGGQTFTNNIVIDWSTWDGGSSVNGYCFSEYSNQTGRQVWDNWMLNSPYTCSTFGDWYLVNFQEMSSLLNMNETYGTDGYPFNIAPITANTMFTSTTYSANTSQVFRKSHNINFLNTIARSGFYRAMLVRIFTISGTTLT